MKEGASTERHAVERLNDLNSERRERLKRRESDLNVGARFIMPRLDVNDLNQLHLWSLANLANLLLSSLSGGHAANRNLSSEVS